MFHPCCRLLMLLAVVFSASTAIGANDQAALEKSRIPDPNSTFQLSTVLGATPMDEIQVELTLDTANQVNFFSNKIGWDTADLSFVGAEVGPTIAAAAETFLVKGGAGEVEITFDTGRGGPIAIDPAEPIAILTFEVQCFGTPATTAVDFLGGDDFNYYVNQFGTPLAPNLANGSVSTQTYFSYFQGSVEDALPGQSGVVHTIRFGSSIPAAPLRIFLSYDSSRLTLENVAAGADIPGVQVFPSDDGQGTLRVDYFFAPLLDPSMEHEILAVSFATTSTEDDYHSILQLLPGTTNLGVCGDQPLPPSPYLIPGKVVVPDHTADLELGSINVSASATHYDVPFVFDSTFPVDDYEFEVTFDPDLTFDQAIAVGDFAFPNVNVDAVSPNLIHISEGTNPDPTEDHIYTPDELPATVFKLRFTAPAQPVPGDTYTVSFSRTGDPLANTVLYVIDGGPPPQLSFADLTFESAMIHVAGSTPTCPTLYSFDGKGYTRQNTVLAECAVSEVDVDVVDHLELHGDVALQDGRVRLQLREDDVAQSRFSDFGLLAIDHDAATEVRTTRDGQVIELGPRFAVQWAKDHKGQDITKLVASPDGVAYDSRESGWLDVSYGVMQASAAKYLADSFERRDKDPWWQLKDGVSPGALEISLRGSDGAFVKLHDSPPRYVANRESGLIDATLAKPGQELVLRYSWSGGYRTDFLELQEAALFEGAVTRLNSDQIDHSAKGAVAGSIVELRRGESIDLSFDASSLPELGEGMTRQYVFVSEGRYETPDVALETALPTRYSLEANTPNPFNPRTTIAFELPRSNFVQLAVYDVRGQRVRTLVSEAREAGRHSVEWDGRSDAGAEVASGLYFYRVDAGEFTASQKMMLLK